MKRSYETLFPLAVAGLIILLFTIVALYTKMLIESRLQDRFQNQIFNETLEITATVERTTQAYAALLYASRALFDASVEVERNEWSDFVRSLHLESNYPSITILEFVKRVASKDIGQYVSSVRAQNSHFSITPEGKRNEYYIADYIEPFAQNTSIFGFDLFSNEERKYAIELARDTNAIVVTSPTTLVNAPSEPAFLIMLPVYKRNTDISTLELRRKHIIGVIIAVVNAKQYLKEIFTSAPLSNIHTIELLDITNEEIPITPLINETGEIDTPFESGLTQSSRIMIGTRTWLVRVHTNAKPKLATFEHVAYMFILISGLIFSFLVWLALNNQLKLKSEAEKLAAELTIDLSKFQLAVEQASDQIIITDPDGFVEYANVAASRLTGLSKNEIIGQKAGSLHSWGGLMPKEFYTTMWKTIKIDKQSYSCEIKNKRNNQEEYVSLLSISPIIGPNGQIEHFVAIEKDISEEKRLEKMKDEFLSVASHELRTPLTAIDGIVAMIREGEYGKVNNNLRQPLEDINSSSERLIHLVNDLLSVSRIQAGRLKYSLTEFDLQKVIDETTHLLLGVAKKKNLKLLIKNKQKILVQADVDKVKQILTNIIGNAIKFTNKGGIYVGLSKEHMTASVSVQDTGIGIQKEDAKKLFNKFQQIETKQQHTIGTGLGLYITKELCKKMGGDLYLASSEPGKGSTFIFTVPIAGTSLAQKTAKDIEEEAKTITNQRSDNIVKA